jgi:hypothetical protein
MGLISNDEVNIGFELLEKKKAEGKIYCENGLTN